MQYDEDPSTPCPEDLDAAILGTLGELRRLVQLKHGGEWRPERTTDLVDPEAPVTAYMVVRSPDRDR